MLPLINAFRALPKLHARIVRQPSSPKKAHLLRLTLKPRLSLAVLLASGWVAYSNGATGVPLADTVQVIITSMSAHLGNSQRAAGSGAHAALEVSRPLNLGNHRAIGVLLVRNVIFQLKKSYRHSSRKSWNRRQVVRRNLCQLSSFRSKT